MKQVIYKYKLDLAPIQSLELPKGSEILTLNVVNEDPYVWVLINDINAEKEIINFQTIGTGHEANVNQESEYLGTYFLNNGSFVAHVFTYKP